MSGHSPRPRITAILGPTNTGKTYLAIERMLERQRFREAPRTVVIRIDPAGPDSGETLFQPVGRQLVAAMKRGLVSRCSPLAPKDGAGFTVELPGRKPEGDV